jgi:BirA family biotin operon repressor/biotin-[acetyl-CoA-carboxylase] ligase
MKEQVLALLTASGEEYISGEAMSERLAVSRAAIWKAIEALREDGYEIEAAPRRGYRLASCPDRLTQGTIVPYLDTDEQRQRLICLDTVDSTNNYAKTLAIEGAPSGTAIVADEQTGGRGRLGRSFQSPKGKGIYVTLLYRPHMAPIQAVNLTAYVAVALCDGIEAATGVRPGIKWTNDIVLGGKKLCGILTEMAVEGESGTLQYIITGIGINANHTPADFTPDVEPIATSLYQQLGKPVDRGRLCACIINALDKMYALWEQGIDAGCWQRYRDSCLTLGKPVRLMRGDQSQEAFAEDIDPDFGLIVRYPDGRRETITAGEVSVRGLWGYTN